MELQLHESAGKGGSVTVSEAAFGAEFREPLIHQVVVAYMAGGRAGTKAQKNRSEVRGGGAKPWRQKGTGRARAGSIRSPIWRSGGVTFAAKPRDHGQKVNRKMYRGALRSILSELARQDRLVVVEGFEVESPRTKALIGKLSGLGLDDVLIVGTEVSENLCRAAGNLRKVGVTDTQALDPVALLRYEKVLMTVDAVRRLEEWLG